jgi:hypothetical protein
MPFTHACGPRRRVAAALAPPRQQQHAKQGALQLHTQRPLQSQLLSPTKHHNHLTRLLV